MYKPLPSSNRLIEHQLRIKEQKRHNTAVKHVKSHINITQPDTYNILLNRSKKQVDDEFKQQKIQYENQLLLNKMNTIAMTTDNHNTIPYKHTLHSITRNNQLKRIEIDNNRLLYNIENIKPTYDKNQWKQHAQQHNALKQQLKQKPLPNRLLHISHSTNNLYQQRNKSSPAIKNTSDNNNNDSNKPVKLLQGGYQIDGVYVMCSVTLQHTINNTIQLQYTTYNVQSNHTQSIPVTLDIIATQLQQLWSDSQLQQLCDDSNYVAIAEKLMTRLKFHSPANMLCLELDSGEWLVSQQPMDNTTNKLVNKPNTAPVHETNHTNQHHTNNDDYDNDFDDDITGHIESNDTTSIETLLTQPAAIESTIKSTNLSVAATIESITTDTTSIVVPSQSSTAISSTPQPTATAPITPVPSHTTVTTPSNVAVPIKTTAVAQPIAAKPTVKNDADEYDEFDDFESDSIELTTTIPAPTTSVSNIQSSTPHIPSAAVDPITLASTSVTQPVTTNTPAPNVSNTVSNTTPVVTQSTILPLHNNTTTNSTTPVVSNISIHTSDEFEYDEFEDELDTVQPVQSSTVSTAQPITTHTTPASAKIPASAVHSKLLHTTPVPAVTPVVTVSVVDQLTPAPNTISNDTEYDEFDDFEIHDSEF